MRKRKTNSMYDLLHLERGAILRLMEDARRYRSKFGRKPTNELSELASKLDHINGLLTQPTCG